MKDLIPAFRKNDTGKCRRHTLPDFMFTPYCNQLLINRLKISFRYLWFHCKTVADKLGSSIPRPVSTHTVRNGNACAHTDPRAV